LQGVMPCRNPGRCSRRHLFVTIQVVQQGDRLS
jgi:hypothetical protein